MNKILKYTLPVAVLLVLFFASCSFTEHGGTGNLLLPSGRALTNPSGRPLTMRYSLERNGNPVKMNGKDVIEVGYNNSVLIENLVPGSGYVLSLSVGDRDGKNLKVLYLGNTSTFSILEGTETEASLSLIGAPKYDFLTVNGAVSSAVIVDNTLYVLDGTKLRSRTVDATGNFTDVNLPSGVVARSLTKGLYFADENNIQEELWLNTTKGLYRLKASGVFEKNMPTGLSPSILFSEAVRITDDEDKDTTIIVLYSAGGIDVGMLAAEDQDDFVNKDEWESVDTAKEEDSEIADFVDVLTTDLLLDLAVNRDANEDEGGDATSNIYYIATPLGTLIGSSDIEDLFSDDDEDFADILFGSDFWLEIEGESIKRVSSAGDRVYASPEKGVYAAKIGTDGLPTGGLSLISGTGNRRIRALNSIKKGANTVITAAVTDKNAVLVIENASVKEEIPATAGMPTKSKPFLYKKDNKISIILSGENGSVELEKNY